MRRSLGPGFLGNMDLGIRFEEDLQQGINV